MIKVFKYLKTSWISILIIIGLLFIQAACDLTLPDYTSKIVNVGIQQGGIEDAAASVISEITYNKLMIFISDKDRDYLNKYYDKLDKNEENLKKYPLLKKEKIYKLDTNDNNIKNKISNILKIPFMIDSMLTSGRAKDFGFNLKKDEDPYIIINSMSKDQKKEMFDKINVVFKEMPDSISLYSAINAVKSEYEHIGLNTSNIQTNYVLLSGFKMLLISLIIMVDAILIGLLGSRLAGRLAKVLREKVFEKVVGFSRTKIKEFGTSSLITRTTNDIQQVQQIILFLMRVVFYAPIIAVGGILKTTSKSGSMGWIIFGAVCALILILLFLFTFVMPKFKIYQTLVDKLNLVAREILSGIPVIRAFSNEKHEEKRFDNANKNLYKVDLFIGRAMSTMMPLMSLLMYTVCVAIVWKGAYGVNDGNIQVGDIMAYIQYTMQIIMSFIMIGMMSIMLPRAIVSANRISKVLESDSTIRDPKNPKEFNNIKGVVEFKNVSFRYPDAQEDVITEVNLKAMPGTITAFIGSTGSGKSTLINLIPRFYDVTEGSITIDGINIKDVKLSDLRSKIGYVPQKGMLFSGTIKSNIKYGDTIEQISDEEMIKASKIAQADEFVNKFEDKYDSKISQDGTNVSGGQRQRLAIARAIAINPKIFIFDDSFSALDFKTDLKLRKELTNITKNSTVFIVAQRISTIINADQIVVLDEGKVVGIGTHEELMKNNKVYKEIALSQLSEEELSNV